MNKKAFAEQLEKEYDFLYATNKEYAYSASKISAKELAVKMTMGLEFGVANKNGDGIKRTCKFFKIPYTYKAIAAFLN